MSSYITEELLEQQADAITGTHWQGTVAVAAGDMSDRISVVLPGLDPENRLKKCRWQARDDHSLPARGDRCLVLFDDQSEPWVIAWWPFTP